ncbi:MAG TPA: translocation/assembly module TamB domain-containing protein [Vicinamibacteria bacterium]|nr:translocation/assembly module TamB domain-containing protein [Vicinamibacteria bacterium]
MARRGRVLLLVALVVIVLLVMVLMGYLPQDIMRRYVEKRLQSGLGAGSSIGRMETVPGRLRTEVEDLVIQGPTYKLTVPRARVVLSPGFLFGDDLSFLSVELDSPRLEVTPSETAGPQSAVEQPIHIESLVVTNATIVYHLGPRNQLTLTGVSMRGSVGEGTLTVAASGGSWQRETTVPLGPASGRLRVSPRLDIAVETLQARVLNSQVQVSGTLGRVGAINPDLRLQARIDLRDLKAFGLEAEVSGRVTAAGRLSGLGDALTLDAKVEGGNLKISDWPIDRIDAHLVHRGDLEDGRTEVTLEAALLGGRAEGEVELVGRRTSAFLQFSGIDVAHLRRQIDGLKWPESGELSGTLTASGDYQSTLQVKTRVETSGASMADMAVQARLDASGAVRIPGRTLDLAFELDLDGSRAATGDLPRVQGADLVARGRARGAWDSPTVEATLGGSLAVQTAAGPEAMPVSGRVRYAGGAYSGSVEARGLGGTVVASAEGRGSVLRRLEAQGTDVDLGLVWPEAAGQADFQLSASGPIDRLTGTATFEIPDLLWDGQRIGPVTAQAEGVLGRARLTFAAPELRVTGEGTIEGGVLHATLTLDRTEIERLAAFLPLTQTVTGITSGTITLDAPLANPGAATAEARLDTLELATGGLTARATSPVVARLRDRILEFTDIQVESSGVTAMASGRIGLDADAPIEARLLFDADLSRVPQRADLSASGTAHGDIVVSGTRSRPRAFGAVALTGVTVQRLGETLVQVEDGRLDLQGDVAIVEGFRGTVGGGTVELTGTIPVAALLPEAGAERLGLAADAEADLVLRWTDVQAAALVELFRAGPSPARALLSGDARLMATLGSWRDARGELHLTPTDVEVQDLELQVEPITARLEAGRVTTDGLVIHAGGTTFRVDGESDLRARTFQASGRGTLELRALSPLLEDASLTGIADVDVEGGGTFADPRAQGTIRVRDGTLRARDFRQPLTGITMVASVDEREIRITEGSAQLGGGPVSFSGTARLAGLSIDDVNVEAVARGVGLRYPVGGRGGRVRQILSDLKARVDADLTLTGRPGDFLMAGSVAVERSLYDTDIFLEEALLAPTVPPGSEQPSRLLQSVALNLAVVTTNPFIIRNNLAQVEAEGGLSVRGDMATLAPYGRFDLLPGGKIFLQQREFVVEDGSLTYTGTTDPEVSVRATTVIADPAQDVEVTVVVTGTMPQVTLDLSSTPSLSEQEIASLVATGRSDVSLGTSGWVVGEQAATLLLGRYTRAVARQLIDLGIDQVDIQPELVAREGQPSARFTFGKQLSPAVRFIYSMGLSNPEERYYELQYGLRVGRQITMKLQRRFDGSYQFALGQRLAFGGPPRTALASTTLAPTELADVRLEGELADFPEVLEAAKASPGDEVTYWDLLDDAERIRQRLVEQGYLEAVVDARLEEEAAVFAGVAGRRHRWRVEGMANPPNIDPIITGALFKEEGLERAREALLEELRRRGHLRAGVEVDTTMEDGFQVMMFQADPGPALAARVTFPGATGLSHAALLEATGGPPTLLTRPRDAEEGIRLRYREAQYLTAKVGPVRTAEEQGAVQIEVPVEEGPQAKVVDIRFRGATLPEDVLAAIALLPTGGRYEPEAVNQAVLRLRDRYLSLGHPAVRVNPDLEQVGPDLAIVFNVDEGRRQTIGPVRVRGLRRTSERFVRAQLRELERGDPLDPRVLARVERRLRDLGVFRRAVLTASQDETASITVELEEAAPYLVAYDVRYNQLDQLSGSVDGQVQNLFGRAVSLGLRVQAGRWVREGRASLHFPSIWRLGDLTASAFDYRQTVRTAFSNPGGEPPPLDVGRRIEQGFQLQQAVHRFRPYDILYGYRYRRTTCPGEGLPPVSTRIRGIVDPCDRNSLQRAAPLRPDAPISVDVGAIDTSVVRDTRDNPINPTRGAFLSANVEYAPRLLGSDFDYVRQIIQGSFNVAVGRALTWSQRYSIGTIHTFGTDRLPVSDLFKAGGANTVRGFATDSLGPQTPAGEALGGGAMILLNQELRYQHPTGLGAAAFYDAGNVFDRVADFDLRLRHSLGVGVRYASGFGLVRLDVAFPLNRRPEDRAYQLWLGFGQVF